MKILFLGDIVGQPGREYAAELLRDMTRDTAYDLIVANGENASRGRGLTQRSADELYDAGIEILTMGNHVWDQRDIFQFIDDDLRIVRPANFPKGTPGRGFTICKVRQIEVLIVNVMGRTFLSQLDCPFEALDDILEAHPNIKHVIVDVHAEVTSEKLAMGWEFDGRVSVVVGTHTHVPTADARILPKGTGFITDIGMVGPYNGILGMEREAVIRRMRSQMPARFEVADGPRQFSAVEFELDDKTGRCLQIRHIHQYES